MRSLQIALEISRIGKSQELREVTVQLLSAPIQLVGATHGVFKLASVQVRIIFSLVILPETFRLWNIHCPDSPSTAPIAAIGSKI